jgi:hypothetical protein
LTTLFQAVDPRGITVTCTTERWEEHISGHREMSPSLANDTITDPLAIYRSGQKGHAYPRDIYYRLSELLPPRDHGFVKVVTDVVPAGPDIKEGRVVTAFHADEGPSSEDELIWSAI